MADIVMKKCDECGTLQGVTRYTLKDEQRTAVVDLCGEDDQKPLRALLDAHAPKSPSSAPKPRRSPSAARRGRKVVDSLEELEDLKARGQI